MTAWERYKSGPPSRFHFELAIDERAEELKAELRIIVEREARKHSPGVELLIRRLHHNPNNHPGVML